MRGLTPAERAELARFPVVPTGNLEPVDDDAEEVLLKDLAKQGRMSVEEKPIDGGGINRIYRPTPLGRLALRLWPATMATPGAGDRP